MGVQTSVIETELENVSVAISMKMTIIVNASVSFTIRKVREAD